jgi:hypothetical protein
VAPAFLLSDYSLNRRRATLVAAVIDLEARLADGAIQMFDRLIGGMFTRARRGRERRYQDSIQLGRRADATVRRDDFGAGMRRSNMAAIRSS